MDDPPAPGPSSDAPPLEPTTAELAQRLEEVEAGLARLGGRLEALAVSLEASFETAVATEVQAAAAELRHTVSELGRILVRDLGKLPQMLTKHRQAIVAELRGTEGRDLSSAGPAGSPAGDSSSPEPAAADDESEAESDLDADAADTDAADTDAADAEVAGTETDSDSDTDTGGERNWRGHLRRHRQV